MRAVAVGDGRGRVAQPGLKLRSAGREVSNEGLEVMPCHCRDYRDDGPGDYRMG